MSTYDTTGGGRLAYVAYHIWLFRNSLNFEAKIVQAYCVLKRAYSLFEEYITLTILTLLANWLSPQVPGTPWLLP